MRQYIHVLLLCLVPMLSTAQGENNNWYFGQYAGVNFAAATPVALSGSPINTLEACGTASDANGNLLFYTDGSTVWNRDHQVMQNGSGLTGHYSSQQLAIVKHPGNPNQYYIFTTGLNYLPSGNRIAYSIEDMSLGNLDANGDPLGKVLENFKNILVLDNLGNPFQSEAITVVASSFNTFWVLIPNNGRLCSYTVNSSGFLNGAPVISNLVYSATTQPYNHFSIKASRRLASGMAFSHYVCITSWANPDSTNKVFSFDNTTGQITNDYALEINNFNSSSSDFNKDGSVLFLGFTDLYAVDLLTSTSSNVNFTHLYNLPGSPMTSTLGSIQRNKYNDIYISAHHSAFLGKIINPDVYGPGMGVDMNFIGLATYSWAQLGLPQLIPEQDNTPPSCIPDIVLTLPETYSLHTYKASNTITTKERYTVFPKQDITMKAGRNVMMLPNTYIMNGARFFATIEECRPPSEQTIAGSKNTLLSRGLDKDGASDGDISVYPNPASSWITIDAGKKELIYWELYDMMGKKISTGRDIKVKVAGLLPNTYLLKIGTGNGATAYKKITIR